MTRTGDLNTNVETRQFVAQKDSGVRNKSAIGVNARKRRILDRASVNLIWGNGSRATHSLIMILWCFPVTHIIVGGPRIASL